MSLYLRYPSNSLVYIPNPRQSLILISFPHSKAQRAFLSSGHSRQMLSFLRLLSLSLKIRKNPLNFTWSLKDMLPLCSHMSLNITRTCFSKIVKIRCKHRDRTHNLKKKDQTIRRKKTFTISHDREKSAYRHVHLSGYL